MTEEAKAIARKMLHERPVHPEDIVIGGEIFITEPIEPPKRYHKETKEAWNNLMKLFVDHGELNQRDLPRFRMMFDNLDYYYTASETIEKATEQAGKVSPAAIYGNLKDVIAARDTFARNYQEYAKIFDNYFSSVTKDDLREKAVDNSQWRDFIEQYDDPEEWEDYKAWYADYHGIEVTDFGEPQPV